MKKQVFPKNAVSVCCLTLAVFFLTFTAVNASTNKKFPFVNTAKAKITKLLNEQPVEFLENKGQLRDMANKPVPFVLFKAEAPGIDLYITEQGLTYVFFQSEEKEEEDKNERRDEKTKVDYERIDLLLSGASIKKENIIKEDSSIASFNYLFGSGQTAVNHVKKFRKIIIRDIYPGIDWVLYSSTNSGFKYDFIVHTSANASQIEMVYTSGKRLSLTKEGDLLINTKRSQLAEKAPYSYLSDNHQQVESSFNIISTIKKNGQFETRVGFNIANQFTLAKDFVIDPQLLWSTCYGGSLADGVYCIDTDPTGNLFVCGYGSSSNFPLFNGGSYYQTAAAGGYILKFSNSGTLLWATFFGSPGQASPPFVPPSSTSFLATDNSGNVFLSGVVASGVFPLVNATTYYQSTSGGSLDAYIAKFSSNGTLVWATYYGGNNYDDATGLATDPSGNVFLCGTTQSTNFPLQNNSTYFEAGITGSSSGYIVKFDNSGNRIWATYLKGCGVPKVTADIYGNIYLTGNTNTLIPLMNPGGSAFYQGNIVGTQDAYILKFTNNGTHQWGTYYGGTTNATSAIDIGYSIVTDKWANIFITGATTSTNFPVMNPGGGAYLQSTYAGTGNDLFILKFDSNLNRLWATLLGGSRNDSPSESDNLSVDTCGNVWLGFNTVSRNLPFQQACNGGGFYDNSRDTSVNATYNNIYLARFSNNGNLIWSSFFGGDGDSHRCTWDTDKFGNAFMVGEFSLATSLSSYPVLNAGGTSYYSGTVGGDDLAIAKFSSGQAAAQSFSYANRCVGDTSSQLPQSLFSFGSNGSFTASPGLIINSTNGRIHSANALPGTYTITYWGSNCDCPGTPVVAQGSTTIAILTSPVLSISASQNTVCVNQTVTLTANGANSYSWSTGPTTTTLSVQPATPNTFTYSLSGSAGGCVSQKTIGITAIANPTVGVISSPTALCLGQQATLTANGANSYVWTNGPSTGTLLAVASTTNPLNYSVTGTGNFGCTGSTLISIPVLPAPSVSIAATRTTICVGEQVTLTASGANNYSWSTGSKAATITVSSINNTSLSYTVTATGSNGCKADKIITILVSTCNGVDETLSTSPALRIFPNPNSGEFTIASETEISLNLVNELGQFIRQIELTEKNNKTLLITGLPPGLYFLKDNRSVVLAGYKIVVSE